ncbi:MAG: RecX family transcriptional regulator [Candidatus Doudnabacteria bacterium]|nr:RecX family transcriptional regulator [Candidatus Doudnabacteria bacterium]
MQDRNSDRSVGVENVYNRALKLLKRRQHSSFELQRKLEARGYSKSSVVAVLVLLREQDYLNDERFAEIFLDNLIKYKTFGFYGLKGKLLQRGIDKGIIDDLLSSFGFEDEKRIALKILEKKRERDPVKLARSLSAKGFRSQVIKDVLNF